MTDNEIIKGLECLAGKGIRCRECSFNVKANFPKCQSLCAEYATNLIQRQQAEIRTAKANAITSFEDKLIYMSTKNDNGVYTVDISDIQMIAKEMRGRTEQ